MAGTDFSHHRHFAAHAENYRRVINKMMNEDLMYNGGSGNANYFADKTLWERVPQFGYELPPTTWAISTQKLALTVLLLWALFGVGAAVAATRSMSVG
jgi:ABC-2 type transport system permease protein